MFYRLQVSDNAIRIESTKTGSQLYLYNLANVNPQFVTLALDWRVGCWLLVRELENMKSYK